MMFDQREPGPVQLVSSLTAFIVKPSASLGLLFRSSDGATTEDLLWDSSLIECRFPAAATTDWLDRLDLRSRLRAITALNAISQRKKIRR